MAPTPLCSAVPRGKVEFLPLQFPNPESPCFINQNTSFKIIMTEKSLAVLSAIPSYYWAITFNKCLLEEFRWIKSVQSYQIHAYSIMNMLFFDFTSWLVLALWDVSWLMNKVFLYYKKKKKVCAMQKWFTRGSTSSQTSTITSESSSSFTFFLNFIEHENTVLYKIYIRED